MKGIPPHKIGLEGWLTNNATAQFELECCLCNATRLITTQLGDNILEAQIMIGSHIANKVLLPRIAWHVSNTKWPFVLSRRQFPVRLCYPMTTNYSQGETLQNVGLYLPPPVFIHG
jgi:ATP-dependent DNA helicase PIF1